jgi:pSer/pThr/pTyr-binding forkhead associated (FHA) protein
VIGRDAGCDVVVPNADVSRRHAEIVPAQAGYVLTDLSTNGVFVNGDRVKYSVLLGRGDVIRLGSEELRFHADAQQASGSSRAMRSGAANQSPVRAWRGRPAWVWVIVVAAIGALAFLVMG